MQILDERFARGEIDEDEYHARSTRAAHLTAVGEPPTVLSPQRDRRRAMKTQVRSSPSCPMAGLGSELRSRNPSQGTTHHATTFTTPRPA